MATDNEIIVINGAGDAYGIELNSRPETSTRRSRDTDITITSTGRSRGIFSITPGYLTTSLTDVNIDARGRIADGVDFTAGTGVDLAVSGGEIIASGAFSGVNGLRLNSSGSMNLTVDDTDMTVSTTGGEAYGINGIASGDVNASITGGSIDASGVFGTGGWLEATGPGSRLNLHISGSDIRATGTVGETHGLYFHGGLVDAAIADTDLTVSNTDNTDAVGILGVATDHLNASVSGTTVNVTGHGARGIFFGGYGTGIDTAITDTDITATGAAGEAYGIDLYASTGYLDAMVMRTDTTVSATGGDAYGIDLTATAGDIDAEMSDVGVTVTSAGGWAYCIRGNAADHLHASVSGASINAVGTGAGLGASGIFFEAPGTDMDVDIAESDMTIRSAGWSRGIFVDAAGYLTASIAGTGIDSVGAMAYGVDLTAGPGMDLTVSGGDIIASGTFSGVSGIRLDSGGFLNATIDDTDIAGSTTGGYAYGINAVAPGNVTASIAGGRIDANGIFGMGVWLEATGPGARLDLDTSGAYIRATGTGGETYGLCFHGGLVDAAIADTDLTVSNTDNTDAVGILGVATDHLNASVSGTTVNVTGHSARGIFLGGYGTGVDVVITGDDVTATGIVGDAYGIYLNSYSSGSTGGYIDATVEDTDVTASSGDGISCGIRYWAGDYLHASMTGGSVDADGAEAFGILSVSHLAGTDLTLSGIDMAATGTVDRAYGVYSETDTGDAVITIADALVDVDATGAGGWATGINLVNNHGDINATITGATIDSVGRGATGIYGFSTTYNLRAAISGGSITAHGEGGTGIHLIANEGMDVDISVPRIHVTGDGPAGGAYGIRLETYAGDLLAAIHDIESLVVNSTNATADGGNAYGIFTSAHANLFADISGNHLIDVDADGDAYGIFDSAGSSLFGDIWANPMIDVDAAGNAYGICLHGGVIGGLGDHATVSGNGATGLTVDSTNGSGAGILLISTGGIFADVTGNGTAASPLSVTGPGTRPVVDPSLTWGGPLFGTFGILAFTGNGNIGGTGADALLIGGNHLAVSSGPDGYNAYGILGLAQNNLYADVTDNTFTVQGPGGMDAFSVINILREHSLGGITLIAGSGSLGGAGDDVLVSGNVGTVRETIDRGDPIGIDATGIFLYSFGGSVFADSPGGGGISDNMLTVTASGTAPGPAWSRTATGVMIEPSFYDLFASVTGNDLMTGGGITGYRAQGIYLYAPNGPIGIGNAANPVSVSGNSVLVNAVAADVSADFYNFGIGFESHGAGGIHAAYDSLLGRGGVLDNTLTVSNANNQANGINFWAHGTMFGTITNNTATITSTAARNFLQLYSDSAGTGNAIDWTGNPNVNPYISPGVSGIWSGNYAIGGYTSDGPVLTNLVYPGEITP